MPIRRRPRDRYLNHLAAEVLFRDVPRHLIAVVGRSVDRVDLASGASLRCDLTREAILIAEGNVVVVDGGGRATAAVGAPGVIARTEAERETSVIVATSSTRCYVVARRELKALAQLAPRVAEAIADGQPKPVSAPRSARSLVRASRS
jgi:hypothetical protein